MLAFDSYVLVVCSSLVYIHEGNNESADDL